MIIIVYTCANAIWRAVWCCTHRKILIILDIRRIVLYFDVEIRVWRFRIIFFLNRVSPVFTMTVHDIRMGIERWFQKNGRVCGVFRTFFENYKSLYYSLGSTSSSINEIVFYQFIKRTNYFWILIFKHYFQYDQSCSEANFLLIERRHCLSVALSLSYITYHSNSSALYLIRKIPLVKPTSQCFVNTRQICSKLRAYFCISNFKAWNK